jgi:hypothetical protein
MFRENVLLRGLIIAGFCVLAAFLGFQLATPDFRWSQALIGGILLFLTIPFFLGWHHALLICVCNFAIPVFVLPGNPRLAYVMAGISLLISFLQRTLLKREKLHGFPSLSYPLIALGLVTVVTMFATGGVQSRAFGSEGWGAGRYIGVFGGIIVYFALVAQPISPRRAKLLASLFFLSGVLYIFSDLPILAGSRFQFISHLLGLNYYQSQYDSGAVDFQRFPGIAWGMIALCYFLMMRYGIRGMFDWHYPLRAILWIAAFILALMGGYRSTIVEFAILLTVLFYFEKLFFSPFFFVLLGSVVSSFVLLSFVANRLPAPVQRSISFLPLQLDIDHDVKKDATGSMNWRLEMWQLAAREVPEYFFRGKGFIFDGTDMYLTTYAIERGMAPAYATAMITSDYHSGPLSLIIPLGVGGLVAFLAFCWGAWRALSANYRYGDPALRRINTFLLALFVTHFVWFMVFYGEFYLDLITFTSIAGLSLALNGGVRRKEVVVAPQPAAKQQAGVRRLQPA